MSAVSLLPYLGMIRNASSWNMLVQIPDYTMAWFWDRVGTTVGAGGIGAIVGWLEVSLLAVICGTLAIAFPKRFHLASREQDVALFSLVTLVTAVGAVFLFLHILSYPTQAWYYLALLAVSGVCIDALFGALVTARFARILRLVGVVLIAGFTIKPAVRTAQTRLTNVDLIASQLRTMASPNDIILVSSWPNGVSFERYYRGATPWLTVPPLEFSRFHRYDLVKQYMSVADQTAPVRLATDRATEALRLGHRVFVLEDSFFASQAHALRVLPRAPLPDGSWPESLYSEQWSAMASGFLARHAGKLAIVPVPSHVAVNVFENLRLVVADGWQP
jgi:hypothetical protein